MPFTSAQEIFDIMPGHVKPEAIGDTNAVLQFDLTGEGGGQWNVTLANQQATVKTGVAPNPSLTLTAAAADYLAIVNGQLNPMNAFMQGKLKVKGDMALALKMQKLLGA